MKIFHGAPTADPRHQWVGVTFFPYKEEYSNESKWLFDGSYTKADTATCKGRSGTREYRLL